MDAKGAGGMNMDELISRMRQFHGDGEWKPITESYRAEKGLPEGWAFSEEDKKELASRFARHLTNRGR